MMGASSGTVEVLAPVLRYPGSKARLAPWIVTHFAPHQVYCEPFAGSLAVWLNDTAAGALATRLPGLDE